MMTRLYSSTVLGVEGVEVEVEVDFRPMAENCISLISSCRSRPLCILRVPMLPDNLVKHGIGIFCIT